MKLFIAPSAAILAACAIVQPALADTTPDPFTLPTFSLARQLSPVIVHQGKLRPAFVLVRVGVAMPGGTQHVRRREQAQQCRDTLQRCVYLDKDLVLPPMGPAGGGETYFVVASTDMEHSVILTNRICEQLAKVPGLGAKGAVNVTCTPIDLTVSDLAGSVEEQVEAVAGRASAMILQAQSGKPIYARNGESRYVH